MAAFPLALGHGPASRQMQTVTSGHANLPPKMMHLSKMQVFSSISRPLLELWHQQGCIHLKDYRPFVLTVQRLDGTVLLLSIRLKQSPVEDTAKVTCG